MIVAITFKDETSTTLIVSWQTCSWLIVEGELGFSSLFFLDYREGDLNILLIFLDSRGIVLKTSSRVIAISESFSMFFLDRYNLSNVVARTVMKVCGRVTA